MVAMYEIVTVIFNKSHVTNGFSVRGAGVCIHNNEEPVS